MTNCQIPTLFTVFQKNCLKEKPTLKNDPKQIGGIANVRILFIIEESYSLSLKRIVSCHQEYFVNAQFLRLEDDLLSNSKVNLMMMR